MASNVPSSMAAMESATPPPKGLNTGETDKFEIFERWLRDSGAKFSQLELRKYAGSDDEDSSGDDGGARSMADLEDDNEEKKEPNEGVASMSLDGDSGSGSCSGGDHQSKDKPSTEKAHKTPPTDDDGSDEMRGVHAKSTIPPQTVCVAIPKRCLITVEMGQATPIGRKILASDLELDAPKHIFLMIFLLWDRKVRGPSSFFAPYYEILPRKLRNMPVFWTDEELDALAGSHLLAQIADRADAIAEDYASIRRIAPELASVATLDEFQWARMIVCSRNFGLLIDGRRTSALVPHADMLNHYRPRETKWTFDDESQCFTITTLQTIGAGCEVFDSYGQKCNHRFLLNYGFAVEDNREIDGFCPNEVPLELSVSLGRYSDEVDAEADDESGNGSGSPGGDGQPNMNREADCYAKKVAFWTRGEPGASVASSHHPHSYPYNLRHSSPTTSVRGGTATSTTNSTAATTSATQHLGSSFQALSAALAAGMNSTGGSQSEQGSASAAIAEAVAAMAGGDALGIGSTPSATTPPSSTSSTTPSPPIKRVRVCISNNENTRILLSMLRVLACNSHELDHVTGANLPSPFESTPSQRLFGLTASGQTFSSALSAVSQAAMRTCRDVRHPLTLRNERRAMVLLVDVTAAALARYPTTLAQDELDLLDTRQYPRYSNKRHAKLQVRGEKEVLHHFAMWARTAVNVIDIVVDELVAEKRSLMGDNDEDGANGGEGLGRRGSSLGDIGRDAGSNNNAVEHGNVDDNAGNVGVENIGYEYVVQAMEDDDDCHTTIVRYCSDVLGKMRQDEMNRLAAEAMRTKNWTSVAARS